MRKFFQLEKQGKISDDQLQEWIASTPDIKHLPEKAKKKPKKKSNKRSIKRYKTKHRKYGKKKKKG